MGVAFIPAVVGLITNSTGSKILLIKRDKEPFKNLWSLPGGKIESYEYLSQSIIREIDEEISIKCTIQEYLGTVSEKVYESDKLTRHHIIHVFHLFNKSALSQHDCKWFTISKLKSVKNITPSDIAIIDNMFFKKVSNYFDCKMIYDGSKYNLLKFVAL
ncbi:MAG: NUDIX domain-containing protein [Nitrospirota bacterium]